MNWKKSEDNSNEKFVRLRRKNKIKESEDFSNENEYDADYSKKYTEETKIIRKNNAMKFTSYGIRKNFATDSSISNNPKLSVSHNQPNCITENSDISSNFGGNRIKGVLDFKRNSGRRNDMAYKINETPSSFDYKPNFGVIDKSADVKDENYKKKRNKLLKMMKSYECKSEYQIVEF